MDDRNEKVSDSVERDIQGAVKMGADAARTAKTLGKAAAHAAAGDVAGAAAEVVKDPETLKKILLILLIPVISFVLITTMFLYLHDGDCSQHFRSEVHAQPVPFDSPLR